MTLLIAWIGIDQSKDGETVSSLYFGSDSRYSWKDQFNYDHGIKVFGSQNSPEIFSFCGDVLFPSVVISQIIPLIDSGLFFNSDHDNSDKHNKIFEYIEKSLESYPLTFAGNSFTILYGTRVGREFSCSQIKYQSGEKLEFSNIDLPSYSTCIFSGGSGSIEFNQNWIKWLRPNHNNYRTSRGVYHCFEETLQNTTDIYTGGLPQIVGLYRVRNSNLFGYVKENKRYIYGKEISDENNLVEIEWRNENFERINPKTTKLIEGAQKQPI